MYSFACEARRAAAESILRVQCTTDFGAKLHLVSVNRPAITQAGCQAESAMRRAPGAADLRRRTSTNKAARCAARLAGHAITLNPRARRARPGQTPHEHCTLPGAGGGLSRSRLGSSRYRHRGPAPLPYATSRRRRVPCRQSHRNPASGNAWRDFASCSDQRRNGSE